MTRFGDQRDGGEQRSERRKRPRLMLHWQVRLFRQGAEAAIESTTENLSSEGFYCMSMQPLRLGEQIRCDMVIPAPSCEFPQPFVVLRCAVTVTRVQQEHDGFGLGCRIDDYAYVADALSTQTSSLYHED